MYIGLQYILLINGLNSLTEYLYQMAFIPTILFRDILVLQKHLIVWVSCLTVS